MQGENTRGACPDLQRCGVPGREEGETGSLQPREERIWRQRGRWGEKAGSQDEGLWD